MSAFPGKCFYCGKELKGRGVKRHFRTHLRDLKEGEDDFLILAKSHPFWMVIAVRKDLLLEDLDQFLRDVWVECCDHLSMFEIEGEPYPRYESSIYGDRSMKVRLSEVLRPDLTFRYEYDFGTTTEIDLYVFGEVKAPLRRDGISIIGQNDLPALLCDMCGKRPAKYINEYNGRLICDECYNERMKYEVLPLVNSPRAGVCGYEGSRVDPGEYRVRV